MDVISFSAASLARVPWRALLHGRSYPRESSAACRLSHPSASTWWGSHSEGRLERRARPKHGQGCGMAEAQAVQRGGRKNAIGEDGGRESLGRDDVSDDDDDDDARAVDSDCAYEYVTTPISMDSWPDLLVLISPFFFWGTSMVAMKGVLPKAGPLFVAATRLIPAGALLLAFATYTGRKQPSGFSAWFGILVFGIVDATLFQGFLAEGLKRTTAGLGSVIIDSQPLTVAVLAAILFGESLGPLGALGLASGIIGLILLEVPIQISEDLVKGYGLGDLSYFIQFSNISNDGSSWTVWESGEWWMLLAAQSMALGTLMVRWVSQYSDPVMATGWHMIIGGIPLLALSIIQEDPAVVGHIKDIEIEDWLALAYTSVFGSALSYGIFFYNATRGNLTKLSSLTFLTPMFAALFGYLFLDETLTPVQIMGAFITLISIYFINVKATS